MTSELFLRKVSASPQCDMNYLIAKMTFWYPYFLFFFGAILWGNIRACLLGLSSWQDELLLFWPHNSDVPQARKSCLRGAGHTLPVNLVSSSPLWRCKPAKKFHNISLNLIQVIMFRSKRLVYISPAPPSVSVRSRVQRASFWFNPVFVRRYCLGHMQSVTQRISGVGVQKQTTNVSSRYPKERVGDGGRWSWKWK